jgi:hypothetical protein
MKWVTRAGAKTDRVACPWLIRKFIDPQAEFLFVPADQVLAAAKQEEAKSFDAPDADYTHRDGNCSFEVLIEEFGITDAAVAMLARIVQARTFPPTSLAHRNRPVYWQLPRVSPSRVPTTAASSNWSSRCTTLCTPGAGDRSLGPSD